MLKICREQMALTIEEAQGKANFKTLDDIEKGKRKATINQINKLSKLYLVPSWVFMEKNLPDEYNFGRTIASFRTFKNKGKKGFNYKLRCLATRVEDLRNAIISLREEMEESIPKFDPPEVNLTKDNIENASRLIYKWLDTEKKNCEFSEWRSRLENKGTFVFVTSPFSNWSKVDPEIFRGLSIYHDKLPIIIINASDTHKAKSFTLFHELGHLLMKKTMIDTSIGKAKSGEESICDNFAGNILMPTEQIREEINRLEFTRGKDVTLEKIERVSKTFKTSTYATLVRLRNLQVVNEKKYRELESSLIQRYRFRKESKSSAKIKRNINKEAYSQYGQIYSETVIQAYFNKFITLYKARNMFGLKKAEYVLKMARVYE